MVPRKATTLVVWWDATVRGRPHRRRPRSAHRPRRGAGLRAAVRRTTAGGTVLGADECVSAREALAMFFGTSSQPSDPRAVQPGHPGDLCMLASPPDEVLNELDPQMVAATVVAGEVAFERS